MLPSCTSRCVVCPIFLFDSVISLFSQQEGLLARRKCSDRGSVCVPVFALHVAQTNAQRTPPPFFSCTNPSNTPAPAGYKADHDETPIVMLLLLPTLHAQSVANQCDWMLQYWLKAD
eukprot:TRINITY_DN59834_c0_g1_i1.p1 TRINITY_DN59834_c0_g1~~TRINITY_DN59834_c0_g1_i1.p1  ORF type:complete len:117 (+),score=1.44 TRINITY_DN59834_c0_g1_i1:226-576(+)